MGVLTDYFRAADSADVVRELADDEDRPLTGTPDAPFDGIEAKGIDPTVVLGELIAAIRQVPWQTGLVKDTLVWPQVPENIAPDDDPWGSGPWVSRLPTSVRDTLAGVADTEITDVTGRWLALAAELPDATVAELRPLVEELVGLARRASAAGEQLYCWVSL